MKTRIILFGIASLLCVSLAYADDSTALAQAVSALNAKANTDFGRQLVVASVAQETGVPAKTVQAQARSTNLSYGDLLVADSLATASGKTLPEILGLRAKGKAWTQISTQLGINSRSLVSRAKHALQTVEYTMNNKDRRETGRMMTHDAGIAGPGGLNRGTGVGMSNVGPGN